MKKPTIPKAVLDFFKKTGAIGGKIRAKKYSKQQFSEWGKLGGRPKGTGKKAVKKGGR